MSIKRINVGPRMSQAVVHGNTVYLSGQVANTTAGGSVTDQTKEILGQIDALLAEAGTDKSRLLSCQVFLADMADVAAMNRAWDAWLDAANPPARATVEAKLVDPRWKVEITGIAALP